MEGCPDKRRVARESGPGPTRLRMCRADKRAQRRPPKIPGNVKKKSVRYWFFEISAGILPVQTCIKTAKMGKCSFSIWEYQAHSPRKNVHTNRKNGEADASLRKRPHLIRCLILLLFPRRGSRPWRECNARARVRPAMSKPTVTASPKKNFCDKKTVTWTVYQLSH